MRRSTLATLLISTGLGLGLGSVSPVLAMGWFFPDEQEEPLPPTPVQEPSAEQGADTPQMPETDGAEEETVQEGTLDQDTLDEDTSEQAQSAGQEAANDAASSAQDVQDTTADTADEVAQPATEAADDTGDVATDIETTTETEPESAGVDQTAPDTAAPDPALPDAETDDTETPGTETPGTEASDTEASDAATTDEAGKGPEGGQSAAASDVLTVEGFDYDEAATLIDENVSNPMLRNSLKATLQAAQNNREALQSALANVRAIIQN